MRSKGSYLWIICLFLIFALISAGALSQDTGDPLAEIGFQDRTHGLSLSPRKTSSGEYILFLPAYLDAADIYIQSPWHTSVQFTFGEERTDQLADVPMDAPVSLVRSSLFGLSREIPFRVLACSTGTTLHLEAKGGAISYLNEDQSHTSTVYAAFLDAQGSTEYAGTVTMKGRGNGTWGWEKKPYNLDFSSPVSIGPFQEVEQLCLLAEYVDPSKLRNVLGYEMGKNLEIPYASAYEFADVFINGEYQGLYGITTKQEYKKYTEAHQIRAFFELTYTEKGQPYSTDGGKLVRLRDGDLDTMLYAIEQLEPALENRDWEKLHQTIDLPSWARKYAMEELLYNYDMSSTSEYFIVNREEKIQCVLPWDYEYILYPKLYPFDLAQDRTLAAFWCRPNWYEDLLEDPAFREEVVAQLHQNFTPEFWQRQEAALTAHAQQILGSWYCDSLIWSPGTAGSLDQSREILFSYIPQFRQGLEGRLSYLLDVFQNWEDYRLISIQRERQGMTEDLKLQLFLPQGTDLAPYLTRLRQSLSDPGDGSHVEWLREDGSPLDTLTTLESDETLTVRYQSTAAVPGSMEPSGAVSASQDQLLEILLPAACLLILLGVFAREMLQIRNVRRSRGFERPKVPQ